MFDIIELCTGKHLATSGRGFKRAAVQHELEQCVFFFFLLNFGAQLSQKRWIFLWFLSRNGSKSAAFFPPERLSG